MKINMRGLLPALVLGAMTVAPSFGSTIALGITGFTQVGVNSIDFATTTTCPNGDPKNCTYSTYPGAGAFTVTSPISVPFSTNGVTTNELGNITSIDANVVPVGSMLGTALKFITFTAGGSNLDLYINLLEQGAAPGDPFNTFAIGSKGSGASFAVDGYILNTTDQSQTQFFGVFDATFANLTLAELNNPSNLPQETPYSATFTIVTGAPEPASLFLMGIGLLGAGVVARKRMNRAA